jgi:predicted ATPase/DNA-binding CsgD family transcriptional regulator
MTRVAGSGHQTAVAHNLPVHLTSFVDRESDKRSLRELLKTSRLVTLVGAGGAGKSRLATEVARANHDSWPDGVWWIELAAETDVAPVVMANLELPGRGSPHQVVASWLAPRRVLLILDNCEHVIAQSAEFSHHMLQRCPQLTILATSREPLGVPGEVRWPVAPLGDSDALDLFEVRARLVAPDFKVGPANREPVAAMCQRLDRLPLAIEMAAARLDLMSERELLANLNDRFRLLATGSRTVPERQQTMTAAIDWSYRLLTPDEARLFRRLAVFHGGFTLDAAREVGGNGDTLDLLKGLVQKSMVVAERLEDESTRYRLLETHHDYALEKLRESGEIEDLQRRHYEHFKDERWKPRESTNLWAALTWARDNVHDGGLELALEIGDSDWSNQARAKAFIVDLAARSGLDDKLRVRALMMMARLAWRLADHRASEEHADSAVALAREDGEPELVAQALMTAGLVREATGELVLAGEMYDEALELLRSSTDWRLVADHTNARALLWIVQGKPGRAEEMLVPIVESARSHGDQAALAQFLESMGNAQLDLGDVEGAAASWNESLAIFIAINDWFGIIWSLAGLSLVAAARQEDERAMRLAAAADRLSREYSLGTWSFRAGQLAAAREQATARRGKSKADGAWNQGQTMTTAEALEYAHSGRAPAEAPVDAGPLSRREREVAAMVAMGMTNKEIAQRLFIAERTAEGHVERIRNKLGVRSRTEVATWAITHGFKGPLDKPPPSGKV